MIFAGHYALKEENKAGMNPVWLQVLVDADPAPFDARSLLSAPSSLGVVTPTEAASFRRSLCADSSASSSFGN